MAFNVRQISAALNDSQVDYVVARGSAVICRSTAPPPTSIGLSSDNVNRGMRDIHDVDKLH
jgi:hypothetical protein